MELRTHCATDDFSVPEVNGSRQTNGCQYPKGCGRPHDRAGISGILDAVQDEQPHRLGRRDAEIGQGSVRNLADDQNPLRRLGLRSALEFALRDLFCYDAPLAKGFEDSSASDLVGLLRSDKCAQYANRRPEQFLGRSDAFRDEQALPFAGFSPTKVASQGEDLHTGICLAFSRAISLWTNRSQLMRRFAAGAAIAAVVGMSAGCGISQQQEVQVGAQQAQQVNAQLPIVQDPVVNRYLNILGDSIAHVTSRADLDWHFYMVNTNDFNAFALPGGYIYVNRGVAERSDRMDQFASVVAHEIGHVVLRHSVKQMEQMQGANVGVTIACVLTSVCNSGLAQAGINVAGQAVFAKFSREDEAQADAAGVDELVRAGINPNGMPEMFQKLIAERQSKPAGLEAWFTDHPLEEDRVQATRDRIARVNPAIIRTLTSDTRAFQDFKSRVHSLPAPPVASR
jgi:beta-barrel assembly-enhancing protease